MKRNDSAHPPFPGKPVVLGALAARHSRQPKATIALAICLILIATAIFGPALVPQNPYDLAAIDFFDARLPPMSNSMSGTTYWLGTDGQGRDMFSAMVYGLRTSMGVGLFSRSSLLRSARHLASPQPIMAAASTR